MNKRGKLLAVILCILFSITILAGLGYADESDTTQVMVVVKSPFQTNALPASDLKNRLEIAEKLDREYDVEYIGRSINAITISATAEEIDNLKKRRDVKEVRAVPELRTLLQDSNSIINATLARGLQIDGVNLTGAGQGVCVIDSGVNYTHPALGGCTKEDFLAGNCTKVRGGYAFYNPFNSSNRNDVMGDSNHGTHVAGIVVGQGPLPGIASGAHMVAMKACGPTSACDIVALIESINWCVGNATTYNISVISISIGTTAPDLFSASCDSEVPSLTTAINAAVAKNISVVVAAGNDGNKTHISLPGCISSATTIGATDKNDAFASYSNRNSLVKLFAPGTSINSSILSGYGLSSGTSMATPHVSGAIAVIRQALTSLGLTRTPDQLENLLNNTGKTITDTTNVSYSRINLNDAVVTFDSSPPVISLSGPVDIFNSTNSTQMFNASFSDWKLKNSTLIIWNSTGIRHIVNTNISGTSNSSLILVYNLSVGYYNWTFNATDNSSNMSQGTIRSLNITALQAISPVNGYGEVAASSDIMFNYSLNDLLNISNCSLIINSDVSAISNLTSSNNNFSATLSPGSYTWKIRCIDNNNTEYLTENRSITITAPAAEIAASSNSGGGGGGGGSAIFTASSEAIEKGYTRELRKQEKIQFTLFDGKAGKHSLSIDAVTDEYVNITIRSDPISLILGIGQSAKLNLSSADFYDLYIKLEKIENKKATLTIQKINEAISKPSMIDGNAVAEDTQAAEDSENQNENQEEKLPVSFWIQMIFLGIMISAAVVHWFDTRRKHRVAKKKTAYVLE